MGRIEDGVSEDRELSTPSSSTAEAISVAHEPEVGTEEMSDWQLEDEDGLVTNEELHLVPQKADLELSLARYKRTASMKITGEWMQPFVARASFNLAYMYQFGIGVDKDVPLARRYYNHCLEVNPAGVQSPVFLMLAMLTLQALVTDVPSWNTLAVTMLSDARTHVLALHVIIIAVLLFFRARFRDS